MSVIVYIFTIVRLSTPINVFNVLNATTEILQRRNLLSI